MKPRHTLYLDEGLTEQLEALAAKPGSSKSAIVADALRAYLARRAARELDDLLKVRLNRIGSQLNRIERDQQIVLERSEEHTSELQSLMRISYAVSCLKKKQPLLPNQH